MNSRAQPAAKIDTYWPITAAIWRNESSEGKAWYSVTFDRAYKDKDGNPQKGDSYSGEELLFLQKVAGLAHSEVYRLKAHDRSTLATTDRVPGAEG